MRIVFMGTPEFSVPSLAAIAARHDIAAVVTRPDAVSTRGRRPIPSPVKAAALERGLTVVEAVSLRDQATTARIRACEPEAICVVAYGALLPREILSLPRFGCINAHASLLPRHRGAAPIERAILAGDPVTGVSIMRMDEGLDTGPVSLRVATRIADASAAELAHRLSHLAADALLAVLDDIAAGRVAWFPQDESRSTYATKITREDVRLDAALDASTALRRIRASSDRATTRIRLGGAIDAVILSAEPSDLELLPGRATIAPDGPVLGFDNGSLRVTRIKPAGGRALSGRQFACGARLEGVFGWSPL